VLHSVEGGHPGRQFLLSVTAAQILKKFYKRNAFPVAGAAFYLIVRWRRCAVLRFAG
jgi:hypothetical protein